MYKSEKGFERDIEAFLISKEGGYIQFYGQDNDGTWIQNKQHDLSRCIYLDVLCDFIRKTQPKEWDKYVKYYGENAPDKLYTRLEQTIKNEGLLNVLRFGFVDLGIKFKVCFFKPESKLSEMHSQLYSENILGCTRQFRYSKDNTNTIDMVLSLNGIPIVAIELKNQLTGQDYRCAIKQYKMDRNSKEFAFRFNHRFLVYFAVDLYEVWMTTELKDSETFFIPFNQGSNGPGVTGGAGNPDNPNNYSTSYLWEVVLQRDSLMELIQRFLVCVREKKEVTKAKGKSLTIDNQFLIFPRYHQYDVVKKVVADVRKNGAGKNYLIEHSAGSGKSNSIAWIAYRLASLHNNDNQAIFDSVIVVTNRIVLDSQLQDTINSFEHMPGLIDLIDEGKTSSDLAQAINDGKRIIVCTIQKFLFAYQEIKKISGKNFAVIVDEAHQGQSGESAKTLKGSLIDLKTALKEYAEFEGVDVESIDTESDYINAVISFGAHKNQSFFAFTATPKVETLELFGEKEILPDKTVRFRPFHVYSMRQAIEEGFILDVLNNYTTVQEAFKIVKNTGKNPEFTEGAASKALFKYYKSHEHTIEKKTEMIMTNFLNNCRYQIDGKGKAMLVADSRANAVRYYLAIKEYIHKHPATTNGTDVMIAFSGEVILPEDPIKTVYSESSMNIDEHGKPITSDKKFRNVFHSEMYNILVVADKYQTGFDEPLLQSMYVDKKLQGIAAVQTLSRLNRTHSGKTETFVLDFENSAEEIKKAFLPYYEITELEGETDVNKVYDIHGEIEVFGLYDKVDIDAFIHFMDAHKSKEYSKAAIGTLSSLLKPIVEKYNNMKKEDRDSVHSLITKFNKAYSYVTQLVSLHDEELFKEYQYTSTLIRLLPRDSVKIDLDGLVTLQYSKLTESFSGAIILKDKPPILKPNDGIGVGGAEEKKDTLQRIIERINAKFEGVFTESDRVIIEGIYNLFMKSADVTKFAKYAEDNSTEMFVKSLFPDKFKEIATQCYMESKDSFDKLFTDPEFYEQVQNEMAKELYQSLRINGQKKTEVHTLQ